VESSLGNDSPTPLAVGKISARQSPAGHMLYGKRRGQSGMVSRRLPHRASYAETLSCYHQNLSMCSLHAESLCQLSRDSAVELGNNGSRLLSPPLTVIVRNWRADFSDACTERKLMKAAARAADLSLGQCPLSDSDIQGRYQQGAPCLPHNKFCARP